MNQEDIVNRVIDLAARKEDHWKDDQKLRHLSSQLEKVNDSVVFDALISFFHIRSLSDIKFNEQDCAGTLLALRRPFPSISLEDILISVGAKWDASVEQLPWYLALVFGREEFHRVVYMLLEKGDHTKISRYELETFLYWTGGSEEWMLEQLKLQ